MTRSLAFLRRLARDRSGATIVEFGIVAPVMSLLLVGGLDITHTLYTRAALQGVVQKTARDATLESSSETAQLDALDAKVTKQVKALNNGAQVDIERRYYRTFSEAAKKAPEPWTDTNKNGTCDKTEPYQDNNLNSSWDKDGGNDGQGGAKDAVVYTVTMTYPRMLPLKGFIPGASSDVKVVASTVLANQPYANQQSYGTPVVRNCPA